MMDSSPVAKEPSMIELERAIPILIGIPLVAMGFGLTASFGIFAFIGMPLLFVGLGCVSAGTASAPPK
jgi:hypothetical protein